MQPLDVESQLAYSIYYHSIKIFEYPDTFFFNFCYELDFRERGIKRELHATRLKYDIGKVYRRAISKIKD